VSDDREKLAGLLGFYLRNAYIGAGLSWDSDNWAEVYEMVDLVAAVAASEAHATVQSMGPDEVLQ
jgi:hypothetical protein